MKLKSIAVAADPQWLELRSELWPDCARTEHLAEMAEFVANPLRYVQILAFDDAGLAVGLAEAAMRHDYVNGTESSPVAFLEGLYVRPSARRLGYARALVTEIANWAQSRGCLELASDTQLENAVSQEVHRKLGFTETERVVFFNLKLVDSRVAQPLAQPDPRRSG